MILVLNIEDHNKASWLVVENKEIKYSHDFVMNKGEDSTLLQLDNLFKKNKLGFKDIKGLALTVKEASLTQVKIFTAIINTIGWQFNLPVTAQYYQELSIAKILKDLAKQKKFKALIAKYKNKAEITISKKPKRYSLVK